MLTERKKRAFSGPIYTGNTFYIRPTYVVSIPNYYRENDRGRPVRLTSLSNLEKNDHQGKISDKAAAKIKNAINWLIHSARYKRVFDRKTNRNWYFKVNFITLTIPLQESPPSDNYLKKEVFHAWIVYARKYYGLRNYVWKAEAQKNGMIHFHLTCDTFINHHRLRKSWNRILEKAGLLEQFYADHGHKDPNSTDIHSVHKVKNLAAYLIKYMAKTEEDKRKVSGRLWGCNYELSHENKCSVEVSADAMPAESKFIYRREIRSKGIFSKPNYLGEARMLGEVFFFSEDDWKLLRESVIRKTYDERRFLIRNNVANLPQEYFTLN